MLSAGRQKPRKTYGGSKRRRNAGSVTVQKDELSEGEGTSGGLTEDEDAAADAATASASNGKKRRRSSAASFTSSKSSSASKATAAGSIVEITVTLPSSSSPAQGSQSKGRQVKQNNATHRNATTKRPSASPAPFAKRHSTRSTSNKLETSTPNTAVASAAHRSTGKVVNSSLRPGRRSSRSGAAARAGRSPEGGRSDDEASSASDASSDIVQVVTTSSPVLRPPSPDARNEASSRLTEDGSSNTPTRATTGLELEAGSASISRPQEAMPKADAERLEQISPLKSPPRRLRTILLDDEDIDIKDAGRLSDRAHTSVKVERTAAGAEQIAAVGFGAFDALLDVEEDELPPASKATGSKLESPGDVSGRPTLAKRKSLHRTMSGRSASDSRATTPVRSLPGSPLRTPGSSSHVFWESGPGHSPSGSPSRRTGLQAHSSAPDVLMGSPSSSIASLTKESQEHDRTHTPASANIFLAPSAIPLPSASGTQSAGSPSRPSSRPDTPTSGSGLKRTYGARRTMLAEVDVTSGDSLHAGDSDKSSKNRGSCSTDSIRPSLGPQQASYTDLRKRFGVDNARSASFQSAGVSAGEDDGEDEEEEDEGLNGSGSQTDIHDVNALRSAGENRRFIDEIEYLLDGLESADASVAMRRSSAVELVKKCNGLDNGLGIDDSEWKRKLKACGYTERVWKALVGPDATSRQRDRILDTATVVYVAHLVPDRRSALTLMLVRSADPASSTSSDVLATLTSILAERWCAKVLSASPSERGQSKSEKALLSSLHGIAGAVSVRSIILNILAKLADFENMPRQLRPLKLMSETGVMSQVWDTLQETSNVISAAIEMDEELEALGEIESAVSGGLESSLRLLEALAEDATRDAKATDLLEEKAAESSKVLVSLFSNLRALAARHEASHITSASSNLVIVLLKLLVSLTNVSPRWSGCLTSQDKSGNSGSSMLPSLLQAIASTKSAQPMRAVDTAAPSTSGNTSPTTLHSDSQQSSGTSSVISHKGPGHKSAPFDILCLSLAILNNVLESASEARSQMNLIEVGAVCGSKCIGSCNCPDKQKGYEIIVDLYQDYAEAEDEPEKQFLRSYCGLILIYTMLGSSHTHLTIYNRLSQSSSKAVEMLYEVMADLERMHAESDGTNITTQAIRLEDIQEMLRTFRGDLDAEPV